MNNNPESDTPEKVPLKTLIRARSILNKFNYRYKALRNTIFGQNILNALNSLFVSKEYLELVNDFSEGLHIKSHDKIQKSVIKLITFFNIKGYTDKELPHNLIKSLINFRNVEDADLFSYIDEELKPLAVHVAVSQLGIFLLEMIGIDVRAAYSPTRHFVVLFLPRTSISNIIMNFNSKPILIIDFTKGRVINADLGKNYRIEKKVYILRDDKQNIDPNYDRFHFENERRFSPAISNIVIKGFFNKEKKQPEAIELFKEPDQKIAIHEDAKDIDYNEIWKQGEGYVEEARQAIDSYEKFILRVITGFSDKEFLREVNSLKNVLGKVWQFTHNLNEAKLSDKDTTIKDILNTLKRDLLDIGREVIYLQMFVTNALRKEKDRYVSALEKLKNLPVEKDINREKFEELEYLEARFSDACGIVSKMGRLFIPDLPTDYFDFEQIGEIISTVEKDITKAKFDVLETKNRALAVFTETFKYPLNQEMHEEVVDHSIKNLLQQGCGYSINGKGSSMGDSVQFSEDTCGLITLTTSYISEKISVNYTDGIFAELSRNIDEIVKKDRLIFIVMPKTSASLETGKSYEKLVDINEIVGHAGGYAGGSIYIILNERESHQFISMQNLSKKSGTSVSDLMKNKKFDMREITQLKGLIHKISKTVIHEAGAHMGFSCEGNSRLENIVSGTYTQEIKSMVDEELYDLAIKRTEYTRRQVVKLAKEFFTYEKMSPDEFIKILVSTLLPVPDNNSLEAINKSLSENNYDNSLDFQGKEVSEEKFFDYNFPLVNELISKISLVELRKIIRKHFDLEEMPESVKARTERVNAVLKENGYENLLPAAVVDKRIDYT